MRDMYSFMPDYTGCVRVHCDCGKVFDVEAAEEGDHWDARCQRCNQYYDDTMVGENPFPIVPEVGMRPFPERAKGALAVKTEFVETGSEGT